MRNYRVTHDYSTLKKICWRIFLLAESFKPVHVFLLEEIRHMKSIERLMFLGSIVENDELHYAIVARIRARINSGMRYYKGKSLQQWQKDIFPLIDCYYKMQALLHTKNPNAEILGRDFVTDELKEYVKGTLVNLLADSEKIPTAQFLEKVLVRHLKESYPRLNVCEDFKKMMVSGIKAGILFKFFQEWNLTITTPIEQRKSYGLTLISKAMCDEALYPFIFRVLRDINHELVQNVSSDLKPNQQIQFITNRRNELRDIVFN